ncbi:enoyl-CoA hydratase [Marichromatium purpuratum 984]|uniref:Enoyl-CoA hydratase n=1 Tax=Marichromatium purpuratum 984 TaxID=765910 RepID=W0E503_MARPU|nr:MULTISPECIES: enoyl-CoA hydratase-related protein [Marichromatium]AHF04146.1 enoyl-CoA hydratase [Marichromatium purpuratum 984]RNE89802.1 enoyl-CoA hydratase [Marichromatium sp. AB32]
MNPPDLTDARLGLADRVATLTLARDDVRNALTGTALIDDIVATVDWVNACEAVSVLVIAAEGAAFSAGGNIKDMAARRGDFAGDAAELERRYRHGIQRIPRALYRCEVPVIAAVDGPAIGAGCDLACMADLRIASTRARFGETFIDLGLIPGDGGAWFLQRQIGYQAAFALTVTGRVIDAAEAHRLGLVLDVVEPDALTARVHEMASTIAAKSPQALRYAKRLMRLGQVGSLEQVLEMSAVLQGLCHWGEGVGR